MPLIKKLIQRREGNLRGSRIRLHYSTASAYSVGGSLEIKMDDPGIQRSIFKVKHDGSIEFWINQKIAVQESVKVLVLSRRDLGRKMLHLPGIEPRTSAWQAAMLTTIPILLLKNKF